MSSQVVSDPNVRIASHSVYAKITKGQSETLLFFCSHCKKHLMLSSRKEIVEHLKLHRKNQDKGTLMATTLKVYELFRQTPERHLTYREVDGLLSSKSEHRTVKYMTVRDSLKRLRELGKLESCMNHTTNRAEFWLKQS